MINIFICEDNLEQLEKIKKAVSNTIMIENFDLNLAMATQDPYSILEEVKKTDSTSIYFLDIDLNTDMNGIKLAEKLIEAGAGKILDQLREI